MSHYGNITMIKRIKGYFISCILVQIVLGIVYCGYTFYQTALINDVSDGVLNAKYLVICVGLFFTWLLLDFAENYYREYAYGEISKIVKTAYTKKYLHQSEAEFLKRKDAFSYSVKTINTILMQYYYLGLYVSKSAVLFFLSVLMVFRLSYHCGIAVVLVAAFFELLIRKQSSRLQSIQESYQSKSSKVINMVSDCFNERDEIHFNQFETYTLNQFDRANDDAEKVRKKYNFFLSGLETINISQNMVIYIFILIIGCFLANKGMVGIGIVISVSELSVNALNNYAAVAKLSMKVTGAKKIKKAFFEELTYKACEKETSFNYDSDCVLKVENLKYSYPDGGELFHDVSFEIKENDKVLIFGESGSGKSTLLNLINSRLEPEDGNILFNTKDYIYVEQKPYLFIGTVRENLVFGKDIEDEKIYRVLSTLELGLDLDMIIEQNGNNLSGGQKARIGLARALLFHPKLIIADEITAELDAELGERIETFLLDEPDLAVLMVSHRVYCHEKYTKRYELNNERLEQVTCI